ncbi:MAG: hypothetical protein C4589_07725 [Peptococcaceae bacterium]|nr:MAG: hypothetical protein C4589_07725 [Peptococcaceae bacterium]
MVFTVITKIASKLDLILAVLLIILLAAKELFETAETPEEREKLPFYKTLDRVIRVGLYPLLIIFAFIVLAKVLEAIKQIK